ncbi:MAG: hypothetical protein QG567_1376 [Campylobacterota bacterium]|nr:hypothetical protein [Campylobacterota bacterium]
MVRTEKQKNLDNLSQKSKKNKNKFALVSEDKPDTIKQQNNYNNFIIKYSLSYCHKYEKK